MLSDMKKNFKKLNWISALIGAALWTLVMLEFWCWMDPADALGFALIILMGAVPLVTLILSAVNAYHKGLRISVLSITFNLFLYTAPTSADRLFPTQFRTF